MIHLEVGTYGASAVAEIGCHLRRGKNVNR